VYDSYSSGTISNLFTNFTGVSNSTTLNPEDVFTGKIVTLAAGTHTLNLKHTATGAGTSHMTLWELGIMKLGD